MAVLAMLALLFVFASKGNVPSTVPGAINAAAFNDANQVLGLWRTMAGQVAQYGTATDKANFSRDYPAALTALSAKGVTPATVTTYRTKALSWGTLMGLRAGNHPA